MAKAKKKKSYKKKKKRGGAAPPPRPPRPHPAAVAAAIHKSGSDPYGLRYLHNVVKNKKFLSRGAKAIGLKRVGDFIAAAGYGQRGGQMMEPVVVR